MIGDTTSTHLSRREWRKQNTWQRFLPKSSWKSVLYLSLFATVSLLAAFGTVIGIGTRTAQDSTFYSGISKVSLSSPADAPQTGTSGFEKSSKVMTASYYGKDFAGLPTASGPAFDPNKLTAAHKKLPLGTKLLVEHKGKSVRVVVNDRGPYIKGRQLDLSRAAAEEIDLIEPGFAKVQVTKQ